MSAARLFVLSVVLVLIAAACGGGGGNQRLSHSDFVARVNKLCKDATKQVGAIPAAPGSHVHQVERFVFHLRPIQVHFLDEARKLRPPVRDERLWKKAIVYDEEILAVFDRIYAAAKRNDARAVRRYYEKLGTFTRNPYERRLGMTGC